MRTPQTRFQIHTYNPDMTRAYQAMVLASDPRDAQETYLRDAPEDQDKALTITPLAGTVRL